MISFLFNSQNLIDIWTLAHVYIGVCLGIIIGLKNLSLKKGNIFALCLMVLWEIYERIFSSTNESIINSLMDIALGILIFYMTINLIRKNKIRIMKIKLTRHEKAFDIWSINHFIFWGIISLIMISLGTNVIILFSTSLVLMVLWEIYENYIKIGECLINSIIDIAAGILGSISIYLIQLNLNFDEKVGILMMLVLTFLALYTLGKIRIIKNNP